MSARSRGHWHWPCPCTCSSAFDESQRAFDLLLSSSVLCLWDILASEPSDVKQEIHGPECLVILHNIFVKNTQIFCKFAMSFFPKQKKKRSVYLSWVASLHLQNQFHILCNEFCPAASLPKQWIGAHKKKKRRSKVSLCSDVVTRWRFELQTHCLKGNCSAN